MLKSLPHLGAVIFCAELGMSKNGDTHGAELGNPRKIPRVQSAENSAHLTVENSTVKLLPRNGEISWRKNRLPVWQLKIDSAETSAQYNQRNIAHYTRHF
jgi:hypothetical protein